MRPLLLNFLLLTVILKYCTTDEIIAKNKNAFIKNSSKTLVAYNDVPHALFYRSDKLKTDLKNQFPVASPSNVSLSTMMYEKTTIFSSTVYDDFIEENETEFTPTTDSIDDFFTEPYNVTDVSIFSSNATQKKAPKAKSEPKNINEKACHCNILFNICDVNCCCDEDCTAEEKHLFIKCLEESRTDHDSRYCYSHVYYFKNNTRSLAQLTSENLFCILKDNLPQKINIAAYKKMAVDEVEILMQNVYKWSSNKQVPKKKYTNKPYSYGEPLWSLLNTSTTVIAVPFANVNNYCNSRTPIKFLENMLYKCIVKLSDLEMFNIYELFENTFVMSFIDDQSHEVTAQNCSSASVFCTKWKILVCDKLSCKNYSHALHDKTCDESMCTNLATKLEYTFYCNNSIISEAIINLYVQNVSLAMPYLQQEISVNFYLKKENDTVVTLSGNPGYMIDKPILASYRKANKSDYFFNTTLNLQNFIAYPKNVAGYCEFSNITYNPIRFGQNVRSQCKLILQPNQLASNSTTACQKIQSNVYEYMRLETTVSISPLGNPFTIKDEEWMELKYDKPHSNTIFGEFNDDNSTLLCYNLVTKLSYAFLFQNVYLSNRAQKECKLLGGTAHLKVQDLIKFDVNEAVLKITTETLFYDITREPQYEYATGPRLNLHFPNDFFYPFTSNAAHNLDSIISLVFFLSTCMSYLSN